MIGAAQFDRLWDFPSVNSAAAIPSSQAAIQPLVSSQPPRGRCTYVDIEMETIQSHFAQLPPHMAIRHGQGNDSGKTDCGMGLLRMRLGIHPFGPTPRQP